ncbi:probable protein phosphatase 2C 60 [Lycium barbarum]|uniref:probable protein phosphatase 2C 60 n=1 Tax=Lycium barbarum TaxID=112863 RepID=UPI00293F71D5|nr:probable protein phosphatase 2C 60 [Lycium barbarum]XP_060172744.1 probable protein phosphatase 2C 60 [Lycium barbarum]
MGIYLSSPKTEKVSEDGENDRLRYGLSSMQGWRSTMEDAHAVHPNLDTSTSFFGVYDGHGGDEVSKFCAKFLHQEVLNHEAFSAGDISTSIQHAFLRMDEMMRGQAGQRELDALAEKNQAKEIIEGLISPPKIGESKGQRDGEEGANSDYHGPTAGSTACVAILQNIQLLVANAGDSRCVLSREGQAYDMSRDHKPDLQAEKERITNAGGYVRVGRVNGSLNMSRAIGDMELKQNKSLPAEKQIVTACPDILTVELSNDDDFLVLACDGIWDCMSSQEVVDFVGKQLKHESKLSAICETVLDKCLAPATGGEGCDNMTMILVQFKKPFKSDTLNKEQPLPTNQNSECNESAVASNNHNAIAGSQFNDNAAKKA